MSGAVKTILYIVQHPPYGTSTTRELLDAAMAAAAFEQNVQLLFMGDGLWNLLPDQNPEHIASKDIGKIIQALAYYDIDALYVDATSMTVRKLEASSLAVPVQVLHEEGLRDLLQTADCVITL